MSNVVKKIFICFTLYRKVVAFAMIWLVIVNIFALLTLNRIHLRADDAYRWIPVERYNQNQTWNFADFHSRWDSNWYLDVARKGYARNENDTLSNIVFFPVYPLLMKAVSAVFGIRMVVAGWFISMFFCVLACVYLFKTVKEFHKEADPIFAVFLLLIFPTAFFLNAVYTESLFLFLSITAFYCVMKKNYAFAAAFGFAASLTRVTGILLFIPMLVQMWSVEGFNKKSFLKAVPFLAIPLGTSLFFLYHWIRFGDFFLFFKVESAWGRSFGINAEHFSLVSGSAITNLSLDIFYFVFSMGIIFLLVRRKYFSYAVYMASTVLVAVGTGTLMSIGRYVLVLFPIFLVGASMKNEMMRYVWILTSLMLMAFHTLLFVNWYWAG